MPEARNAQGITFAIRGNYPKAIDCFDRSIELAQLVGHRKVLSLSLNNMGNIYRGLHEGDLAISYFRKSLKIKEEMENDLGIANALHNIGVMYSGMGENDSALHYYDKSLITYEKVDYIKGIGMTYKNMGNVYQVIEEWDLALKYQLLGYKIRDSIGQKKDIASSLVDLASLYYDMAVNSDGQYPRKENLDLALKYSKEGYAIAEQHGFSKEQSKGSKDLYLIYQELNQPQLALDYLKIHVMWEDSVNSSEAKSAALRKDFQYEYDKEKAIVEAEHKKDLEVQQELADADKNRQNVIIIAISVGLFLMIVFGIVIFNRFKITKKQNRIIVEQKAQVDEAFSILEEKNQEITDSIHYAKRIQNAILPPAKLVKEYLKESFIYYQPKDIVAGDFYWMENRDGKTLFAAADCTGHGVPGAMVSVICNNGLNRSVREKGLTDPAEILTMTREIVIEEFEKSEEDVKDGMDIALCSLEGNTLEYAGAHNPLWIIREGVDAIEEIKADKQPIGKFDLLNPYRTHTITLNPGDTFFIFSDGFADQFGGEKGKKFKSANFKMLLLSIVSHSMEEQKVLLEKAFNKWKGDLEQLDDVCVIGVRV